MAELSTLGSVVAALATANGAAKSDLTNVTDAAVAEKATAGGAAQNDLSNVAASVVKALAGTVADTTVNVPGDYATLSAALAAVDTFISSSATVTIEVDGHQSLTQTEIDNPHFGRVKIRGATALSKTLVSIDGVTGSAGAWSVTATLSDATGVSVGDVVMVRDVTPGAGAPGEYTGRPVAGALHRGFYMMGYLTTSGTSATLSGSAGGTYLANTDLIVVNGEVRQVSSVAASSFTLNAALTKNVTTFNGWHHMRAGAGTIEVSSGTVTGTGTAFNTAANVGDLMAVVGYGIYPISAITDADTATIDNVTIPAGTAYGIISLGELHEGAWVVTAVSGSQVTWTNTGRGANSKPPVNLVNGGNVYVLTSVLTVSSGSGFLVQSGALDLDHIAVIGPGGQTVGVDLRGIDHNSPDNIAAVAGWGAVAKLGPRAAICGFGYGVRINGPGYLFARQAMFSNNAVGGVWVNFGGQADVNRSVLNGNDTGMFLGPGCSADISDTRMNANTSYGLWMIDAARGSYGEYPYLSCNGAQGLKTDGNCMLHWNGARLFRNISGGLSSDNGIYGRCSEVIALCNGSSGLNVAFGRLECQYACLINNGTNVVVTAGEVLMGQAGAGYSSTGVRVLQQGRITGDACCIVGNTVGMNADGLGSNIVLTNAGFASNTSQSVTNGAEVWIEGYSGSLGTTTPSTLNERGVDGSVITDGTMIRPYTRQVAASITSDQNNYAPTGYDTATDFRISTDASRAIGGLAGGWANRRITIYNVGSNDLVIAHEGGSSTAANRFLLPGSASLTIASLGGASFIYDGASSRWRCVGKT